MSSSEFARSAPISGFPEWLPEVRMVEQRWVDKIRARFEAYGFAPIETPAAESLGALLKKGETSQEVYTLRRLQEDGDAEAKLGLHFDLTVPFARYVAQHLNDLTFPFKRYQIQKVWRGERPQEGRFREFTQCDIDVINPDQVPLSFDAEVLRIAHEVLTELEIGPFVLRINNRKVLEGYYRGIGVQDPIAVIRVMDKLDKIGAAEVARILTEQQGLTDVQAKSCLQLAGMRSADASVLEAVRGLGIEDTLLDEGLDELAQVIGSLGDLPAGDIEIDFSIARGLDYYTGTVYEGTFVEFPNYGSICSGGRYADLAGAFTRRSLPGVGISIGLTRIFAKLLNEGRLDVGPKCPTEVLVIVPDQDVSAATTVAAALRRRGIKVEAFHQPAKLAKQLRYAVGKGIPHVWFPPFREGAEHEVKIMASGEQVQADPEEWLPSR